MRPIANMLDDLLVSALHAGADALELTCSGTAASVQAFRQGRVVFSPDVRLAEASGLLTVLARRSRMDESVAVLQDGAFQFRTREGAAFAQCRGAPLDQNGCGHMRVTLTRD